MRKYILPLCLIPLTTVFGQDLVKEITVDRTIVPEQRAAVRPLVYPSLVMPAVANVDLRMEENTDKAQLPPIVAPFDAARTQPAFPVTPWRGYVDLGYFPSADLGISAGYSIVNKPATQLGAWAQFNNNSYKEHKDADFKYHTSDLTIGVDFSQKFGKFNLLRISTDLGYSRWNNPAFDTSEISPADIPGVSDHRQNLSWHLGGSFDGRINSSFAYGFSLAGGIFNNIKDSNYNVATMVNQSKIGFGAWLRGNVSEKAILGVKAEGTFLHFNSFITPALFMNDYPYNKQVEAQSGKTVGNIDITPAAEFNGGGFYAKIGARFGFAVNSGKMLHVAPDILLGVNPDDRFGAWLKFGGGLHANSLEELMMISRYTDPRLAYELSNVAVNGQLGLRIGPFRGASLTLTLDYASANNWLMPTQYCVNNYIYGGIVETVSELNIFAPMDMRSWKVGARFDWSYRRAVDVVLSYEGSLGNGQRHIWLYWADGARHVAGGQLTLHPGEFAEALAPVKPLTIDVAISARLSRRQLVINRDVSPVSDYLFGTTSYSLGDAINLTAGASWQFNQQWTVFARFNNLLGRHDRTIFAIPTQGFSGLFGLTYKF